MSNNLLPCPFCGGEACVSYPCRNGFTICCDKCNAETDVYSSADEASEAWNTRTERTCKGWPLGFYRFPKNGRAADATATEQARKVLEEAIETIEAIWKPEVPVRVCEEALDVICAAEGLLRKFPEDTVRAALAELDRKATSRGDWF